MKLWKRVKDGYGRFKSDPVGERFRRLHRRHRRRKPSVLKTVVGCSVALALVAGGTFLGLVPGVPGFVLSIAGIAIFAVESKLFAGWADRGDAWIRRLVARIRDKRKDAASGSTRA